MTIIKTIEDLLFAAKGSPMGKPSAIVMTRQARKDLTDEVIIHASGVRESGNLVDKFNGIPVVVEPHAVGVSLRYT